jgi:hypothetical protein
MKTLPRSIAIVLLVSGTSRGLAAQAPNPIAVANVAVSRATAAAPPCTYATCALRVERSIWHRRIVRGATGSSVASLDMPKSSEIAQLFAGSDSASVYGAKYVRAEQINRPLTIVGTALAAVGILQDKRMNGYTISGFSMLAVSIPFVYAQERALSRAVWWYNAGLPGAVPDPR